MDEHRNLAAELARLATEVDSLAKAKVLAEAERDRQVRRREKADATTAKLRAELDQARRRATAAERELARLSANMQETSHQSDAAERELRARLEDSEQAKKVLRHEVEQTERERRALEVQLKEVLANLRQAAREAQQTRAAPTASEVTLITESPPDNGW
jgi:chromosome segregation protein